jgi:hypothetical protein
MNAYFLFSVLPSESLAFKEFFSNADIRKLVEQPGGLRWAGWDLQTNQEARIGEGPSLEIGRLDYKFIRLFEDGTLLVRGSADDDLLTWASKGSRRLNPIALIEFIYSIASFYQRLLTLSSTQPDNVQFEVRLEGAVDASDNTKKLVLLPYGVNATGFIFGHDPRAAPSASARLPVEIPSAIVTTRPGRVAYKLVELIYLWFGQSPDVIPYKRQVGTEWEIDPEAITKKD